MEKLTNEEILRQYKEETDKVRKELIFNEFYMKNEKFPYHIARKYLSSGHPIEDLASQARIGMMKAINKFDPYNGAKFSSFAGLVMTNEILMFFRSENKHQTNVVASMEDVLNVDAEGSTLTLGDILVSETDISADTEESYLANDILIVAKEVLNEREYLCFMNHTSDEPLPQKVFAKQLGVGQVTVSRTVTKAINKIKKYYMEKGVR